MWPETGSSVLVRLQSGQEFRGQLFSRDNVLGLAVLLEPIIPADYDQRPVPLRPSISHTVRIVNTLNVESVALVREALRRELPQVQPIKMEKLVRREQRNVQKRRVELGGAAPSGATVEGMAIFSALSKTLPCYWKEHSSKEGGELPMIVVLDEVHVFAPYRPGDCRGTIKSSSALVERVRKVLECERRRLLS